MSVAGNIRAPQAAQRAAVCASADDCASRRCCYGGAPKHSQLSDLRAGVSLVIATPGRLNDFLEARQVYLHQVSFTSSRLADLARLARACQTFTQLPAGALIFAIQGALVACWRPARSTCTS